VISGLMVSPAKGQAIVERREGLSRADLFELGLYTPPKATPSRCQPRIDEARMKEVAKGIQSAFFFEEKESERIARRWLLNGYGRNGRVKSFNPEAWEDGWKSASLSPIGPGGGIGTLSGGSGCQFSSCRFLYSLACTHIPCATPCYDDPNKFCLYCVGSDGSLTEIGRYSSAEAWLAALEAQVAACDCGNNQSGGECGRLTSETKKVGEAPEYPPAICCYLAPEIPCYANPYRFIHRCYLECPPPDCEGEKTCVMQSSSAGGFICRQYGYVLYECAPCCSALIGTCTGLDCPAECPTGFSKDYPSMCIKYEWDELKVIPYECKCQ